MLDLILAVFKVTLFVGLSCVGYALFIQGAAHAQDTAIGNFGHWILCYGLFWSVAGGILVFFLWCASNIAGKGFTAAAVLLVVFFALLAKILGK